MNDLLRRRRWMMGSKAPSEEWTYILRADSTGAIPKTKIPVYSGQKIHMEWEPDNLTTTGCIFSFYKQVGDMDSIVDGWTYGGYPICWANGEIGQRLYYVGIADLTMPKDLTMYIACWNESEYTGTNQRRTVTPYIKIRIT